MPHRIFVNIHYLEIGGAERALIGLLNALDKEKYEVDLFVNQHTGEFMQYIPEGVRLLPEVKEYSCIERPIKNIIIEGEFGIALKRLIAKRKAKIYHESLPADIQKIDSSAFQFVFSEIENLMPDLSYLGEYDLAISFLQPHNFVLNKVRAKKKICWIHTDYSTIHINREMELPVWNGYDYIASISKDCTEAFVKTFPELAPKIIEIENILSPQMIRAQADEFNPEDEMPDRDGETRILSIGRYSYPKRFDEVARMCRIILDAGAKFRWYIIGYGDDKEIRRTIEEYDVADTLILLGKKVNPYPYIRRCHIYAQPSRYEGKSVTVREAQILCKPVAITNYPTAASQVNNGVDGIILPYKTDAAAKALKHFMSDKEIRENLISFLRAHDYGNENEVNKIYQILNRWESN